MQTDNFLTKRRLLIGSGIAFFILAVVFVFVFSQSKSKQQFPASPTPLPSFAPQETNLPEGKTKTFPTNPARKTGSLVVESTPDGARASILIETGQIVDPSEFPPINQTPFRVSSLPVGKYTLTLFKQDYDLYETTITIKENEVTRIKADLSSIE